MNAAIYDGSIASLTTGNNGGNIDNNFINDDSFPEPDYDHLDMSFPSGGNDHGEHHNKEIEEQNDPFKQLYPDKSSKKKGSTGDDGFFEESQYILGTLVVRIVAARNLEPVEHKGGGIGQIFLGGGGGHSPGRRSSSSRGGTANPYAVVKFGNSTQRTSVVYDSLDPMWPRRETMFMDVSLPASQVTYESDESQSARSSSRDPHAASVTASQQPKAAEAAGPISMGSKNAMPQPPILTVALFHDSDNGTQKLYPTKGNMSGDSDDYFMGVVSVDMTQLLTGKYAQFDEWIYLSGTPSSGQQDGDRDADIASVRIVCEYESSATPPRPGDMVRFTRFCHPADLYPVPFDRMYQVHQVHDDDVLLSYTTSQEGWVCTFLAHRCMLLVCEERPQGAMEHYHQELMSVTERLASSPLVGTVKETARRLPDDGVVAVVDDAIKGASSLVARWLQGGANEVVNDLVNATNWDGRFSHDTIEEMLASEVPEDEAQDLQEPIRNDEYNNHSGEHFSLSINESEPLPNMPPCPITGEPMRNPVVAADGHTYERSAIARWLQASDKSPMTGMVLPHKDLVPNYMLLSSLEEAADASMHKKPPSS